jgi:hypothetical protein
MWPQEAWVCVLVGVSIHQWVPQFQSLKAGWFEQQSNDGRGLTPVSKQRKLSPATQQCTCWCPTAQGSSAGFGFGPHTQAASQALFIQLSQQRTVACVLPLLPKQHTPSQLWVNTSPAVGNAASPLMHACTHQAVSGMTDKAARVHNHSRPGVERDLGP